MLLQQMIVRSEPGRHILIGGDSETLEFCGPFDLILTSPPYFHPRKQDLKHGVSPHVHDLDSYSRYVASILLNAFQGLKTGGLLSFVKTDAWDRGHLLPIGYKIADECIRAGLILHAQWVWQKFPWYSPYSPSFANIFILGQPPLRRVAFQGIITEAHIKKEKGRPADFTPGVFEFLLRLLSEPNDTVLDPFVGTGSVIEAAARTGRWAVGVEISAKQIAVARRQLANRQILIHD